MSACMPGRVGEASLGVVHLAPVSPLCGILRSLLILIFMLQCCAQPAHGSTADALAAFYYATNALYWSSNCQWTFPPDCTSAGVTCNANGDITRLSLASCNITGTLPPEWSLLSALRNMTLSSNQLTGTLPTEWSMLSGLQVLSLHINQLSGTIPPEWSNMSALTHIYLHTNQLTGTLPPQWSMLSVLRSMFVYANQLTGTLPPEWSQLSGLQNFYLYSNQLTGTLPPQFSSLPALQVMSVHGNQLTGTLPPEWSIMSTLQVVGLQNNRITGTIPPQWSSLSALRTLYLQSNQLAGTLPPEWSSLSALREVRLNANLLNGTLPPQWSSMSAVRELLLQGNTFCGTVPSAWQVLPAATWSTSSMDLRYNPLTLPPGAWYSVAPYVGSVVVAPSKPAALCRSASHSPSFSAVMSETWSTTAAASSSETSTASVTESAPCTGSVSSSHSTSTSNTESSSPTESASPSATPLGTRTPSSSRSTSKTKTESSSPTESASPSVSALLSVSVSPSTSASPSTSPSLSAPASPSASETPSGTRTLSSSPSPSRTENSSPSKSGSPSASASLSASISPSASATPSRSRSMSPSLSTSKTKTESSSFTKSASPSPSATPSGTRTLSSSPSASRTETESSSPSKSGSPSASATPSGSGSMSPSQSHVVLETVSSSLTGSSGTPHVLSESPRSMSRSLISATSTMTPPAIGIVGAGGCLPVDSRMDMLLAAYVRDGASVEWLSSGLEWSRESEVEKGFLLTFFSNAADTVEETGLISDDQDWPESSLRQKETEVAVPSLLLSAYTDASEAVCRVLLEKASCARSAGHRQCHGSIRCAMPSSLSRTLLQLSLVIDAVLSGHVASRTWIAPAAVAARVWSVVGCAVDVFPRTAMCRRLGGDVLTVAGSFDFADLASDLSIALEGTVVVSLVNGSDVHVAERLACPINSVALQAITCTVESGGRARLSTLTVYRRGAAVAQLPDAVSFEPAVECTAAAVSGGVVPCSGNGVCDYSTGTCACFSADATGFWAGADCSQCSLLYAASDRCSVRCPGVLGTSSTHVCSGHGVCANGVCTCHERFRGDGCGVECPSANGLECGGHGVCGGSGECSCHADDGAGFWDGSTCDRCADGYVGLACRLRCPIDASNRVCGDRGACVPVQGAAVCSCLKGWCGAACDTSGTVCAALCPQLSRYGASCDAVCPGSLSGSVACSGHGYCHNGTLGSGLCVCDSPFAGADCSLSCPTDAAGAVCGGHGACDALTALCVCVAGFASGSCVVECPGGAASPCSGHGICNSHNASCTCEHGYAAADCSVHCAAQCAGHGSCAAGSPRDCECDAGWRGDAQCRVCTVGLTGPSCTVPCPVADGSVCAGHGLCYYDPDSQLSACLCSASTGQWAGAACDTCAAGYFGPDCNRECSGTACSPCSGHGQCSSGRDGDGRCTCYASAVSGYWSLSDCRDCAAGYFGASCAEECPRISLDGPVCGGHGTCSDGTEGSGVCSCSAGFRGIACHACSAGHFGAACTACPTAVEGLACSGHGSCDDDLLGSGSCTCVSGFGGGSCAWPCPHALGRTCGRGVCVAPSICRCDAGFALDVAGSCSVCAAGFWGAQCDRPCAPCLYGTCGQADGACACRRGYWGAVCGSECPGGAARPCSSHGTCHPADGTCTCDSSPATGFYAAADCSVCDPRYASPSCTVRCPHDPATGRVCSGRGVCWNGTCAECAPLDNETTVALVCGASCNVTNATVCLGILEPCGDGWWGPTCAAVCPGTRFSATTALALAVCSGHGFCRRDTGSCVCRVGFSGTDCGSHCPLGPDDAPCGGNLRGVCNSSTLQCSCRAGYWGAACEATCPGGAQAPCSRRGVCSAESGVCTCDGTSYGAACELPCPGGFSTPCSLNGVCSPTGACECFQNTTHGFFAGANCSQCADSFSGAACTVLCNPRGGVVVGRSCVCIGGFTGPGCMTPCPVSASGEVCSGRGVCVDSGGGGSVGSCVCAADYYGPACETHCTVALCAATGLLRPQCNATTGACECQQSDRGTFAGPTCSDCGTFFWGSECDRACPCNNRGRCVRYTGYCRCFQGDGVVDKGFWSGAACTECRRGYIGLDCATLNTEFSVVADAAARVVSSAYPEAGVVFRDDEHELVYVGSNPIALFASADWGDPAMTLVGTAAIPTVAGYTAAATSMSVWNATHLVVHAGTADAVSAVYALPRGRRGDVTLSFLAAATASRRASAALEAESIADTRFASDAACTVESVTSVVSPVHRVSTINVACMSSEPFQLRVNGTVTWMGFSESLLIVAATTHHAGAPSSTAAARAYSATSPWWTVHVVSVATGAVTDVLNGTALVADHPLCNESGSSTGAPCPNVTRCAASAALTALVCAVAVPERDSTLLVRRTLPVGAAGVHLGVVTIPDGAVVSAAAFDVADSCLIVAMAPLVFVTPPSIFRVRLSHGPQSMALVSQMKLLALGFVAGRIQAVLVRSAARSLYLSLQTRDTVQAMHVNLFGIRTVDPPVVDQAGGTSVTFFGTGFVPSPPPACVFTDDSGVAQLAPAVDVGSGALFCSASPSFARDSVCVVGAVNLVFGNRSTSTTLVHIRRPLSANLLSAWTSTGDGAAAVAVASRGWQHRAAVITVAGFGFVAGSTRAACRVESRDASTGLRVVHFVTYNVTFVNTTLVLCELPAGASATPSNAVLRYSHDGNVFSDSSAAFAVVGEFDRVALSLASPSSSLTLAASSVTAVPELLLETLDAYGNRLGPYDTDVHTARCSRSPPLELRDLGEGPGAVANQSALSRECRGGQARFEAIAVVAPAAGAPLRLYCFLTARLSAYASLTFEVVTGATAGLRLLTPRASWISGVLRAVLLMPAPVVAFVDGAGNQVYDPQQVASTVLLSYAVHTPHPNRTVALLSQDVSLRASPASDATFAFTGVSLRSEFGFTVQLRFTAEGVTSGLSVSVAQEQCSANEYAVAGAFLCIACPPHSVCDGSSNIAAVAGYWRASSASLVAYKCEPHDACATQYTCNDGYTGAYCGSCAAGYGRSGASCLPCGSDALNWLVSAAVVAGIAALVYALSLRKLPFTAVEDIVVGMARLPDEASSAVSLVAKIVISHLQMVAFVPVKSLALPRWLEQLFSGSSQTSSFRPNFSFVTCAVGGSARAQLVSTGLLIPVLLAVFAVAALCVALWAQRQHRLLAQRAKAVEDLRVVRGASDVTQPAVGRALTVSAPDKPLLTKFRALDHASIAASTDDSAQRVEIERVHMDLLEGYDGDTPEGCPPIKLLPDAAPSLRTRFVNGFAVAAVVVLFFLYPSVVQTAISALSCRAVDVGGERSVSVLASDPATLCDGSTYGAVRSAAVLLLALVGVGTLVLGPAAVLFVRRTTCRGDHESARQLFFFATGGYRLWYWESVSMSRKATLAVVITLTSGQQEPLLAAAWVALGYLALNAALRPWRLKSCDEVELGSLAALFSTYLGLAASTLPAVSGSDTLLTGVYSMILAVNVAFFALAGRGVLQALYSDVEARASGGSAAAQAVLDELQGTSRWQVERDIADLGRRIVSLKRRLGRCTPSHRAFLVTAAERYFSRAAGDFMGRCMCGEDANVYALGTTAECLHRTICDSPRIADDTHRCAHEAAAWTSELDCIIDVDEILASIRRDRCEPFPNGGADLFDFELPDFSPPGSVRPLWAATSSSEESLNNTSQRRSTSRIVSHFADVDIDSDMVDLQPLAPPAEDVFLNSDIDVAIFDDLIVVRHNVPQENPMIRLLSPPPTNAGPAEVALSVLDVREETLPRYPVVEAQGGRSALHPLPQRTPRKLSTGLVSSSASREGDSVSYAELRKAFVALSATYMLAPRLLAAAQHDMDASSNGFPASPAYQRVRRHLLAVMELEKQVLTLLVQLTSHPFSMELERSDKREDDFGQHS